MANLFDLIRNKITDKKLQDYANNMQPLQPVDDTTGGAAPLVSNIQIGNDGQLIERQMPPEQFGMGSNIGSRIKNGIKNFNLGDALLGKQAAPTDNIGELQSGEVTIKDDLNPDGETATYNAGIGSTISQNPRRGGLINDITAGARENFNNSFRGENWANNIGSDGRQKGFAYRLGEGIGSLGRFANSPIGRGLLMTAFASGVNGSDMAEALAYGVSTAAKNQQNRTADKLYRGQLKNYGMSDEDLNNLRGYVGKDDFNTLASNLYKNQALQVRQAIAGAQDNTKRANMIMQGLNNGTITPDEAKLHMMNYGITFEDLQKSNASRNADMNEQLLPYKQYALQMSPQIAMGNLGLNQARFNYEMAKDEYDRTHPKGASISDVTSLRKEFSALPPVKNATEITRQYNNVNSLWQQYKNGKIGKNAFDQALITTLNKVLDPTSVVRESEFDRTSAGQAMWDKLSGYATKLSKGGSGLTDANRADLVNALTTMKNANDNEVNKIVNDYADLAGRYGINPSDIMPRHYRPQSSGNRQQSQGTRKTTSGEVDYNALDAELKRRGLL